jgi:hypothetical protein
VEFLLKLKPFVKLCLKSLEHMVLMFMALSMGNIQKVLYNMTMLQYQQFLMMFMLLKMALLVFRRMWQLVVKVMKFYKWYRMKQAQQRLKAARQAEKEARQAVQAARQAERQAEEEFRQMRRVLRG